MNARKILHNGDNFPGYQRWHNFCMLALMPVMDAEFDFHFRKKKADYTKNLTSMLFTYVS